MGNTYYCCKCAGQKEFFYGKCQSCNHQQCSQCFQQPVVQTVVRTYHCCKCAGQKEFFYGKCKGCNHGMCSKCFR